MSYLYIKALHIIFVVSWFAGLFYMIRLYIYEVEAQKKEEPERSILTNQFRIMESRLWNIITWPAAILTVVFGVWMVILAELWTSPWMMLKFGLVAGLLLYHIASYRMFLNFKKGIYKTTSLKLRLWNEIATLFLFAIVFVVVFKDTSSWVWGVLGIVVLGVVLMLATKLYKKKREKNGESGSPIA